jgi:hypothetical protein
VYKILIRNDLEKLFTYITKEYKKDDKFIEFIDITGKLRVFAIDRLYEVKEIDD